MNGNRVNPDYSQNSTEGKRFVSSPLLFYRMDTNKSRMFHVSLEQFTEMFSLLQEKWSTISWRVIVCCLLNTLSNLLPLIIRVNRNAYLKLVLFLLGKHSPGVKTDPLICSRASSNWKAAFVWTRGIRVKNTMEKNILKIWIFYHTQFG